MAYQITFTKRFEKHFKCLNAQERKQLYNKLQLLSENPMHPSLRTKHIQGTKGFYIIRLRKGDNYGMIYP